MENHYYLVENSLKNVDKTDSGISVEFKVNGKTDAQLDEIISINNKWYTKVDLKLQFFVGNNQDKFAVNRLFDFSINVIEKDYPQKDLFLGLNKLRKKVLSSLPRYKVKTKIDGVSTFKDLKSELEIEIDRILKSETTSDISSYWIPRSYDPTEGNLIISKNNLMEKLYYYLKIGFAVPGEKIQGNKPAYSMLWVSILVEEK